jgi:hypothetical protein
VLSLSLFLPHPHLSLCLPVFSYPPAHCPIAAKQGMVLAGLDWGGQ